jgi:hypothetical protein
MTPDTTRTPDYAKVRTTALQRLAASGDVAAQRELQRRGAGDTPTAVVDVATLDEPALRQLVRAWNDGAMPEDRAQSRALAERAYAELALRARVDLRLWQAETAAYRLRTPAPQPPAAAPWTVVRPARVQPWQRPAGSTLYPSEADQVRARLHVLAHEIYDRTTTTR